VYGHESENNYNTVVHVCVTNTELPEKRRKERGGPAGAWTGEAATHSINLYLLSTAFFETEAS
jgi:hypothetical protein